MLESQPASPRATQPPSTAPRPLTIRPSLFLPPRTYKLPSFGSGRNAGLSQEHRRKTTAAQLLLLLFLWAKVLPAPLGKWLLCYAQNYNSGDPHTPLHRFTYHQPAGNASQSPLPAPQSELGTQSRIWHREKLIHFKNPSICADFTELILTAVVWTPGAVTALLFSLMV